MTKLYYIPTLRKDHFDPKVVKTLIIANVVMFVIRLAYSPILFTLGLIPNNILRGEALYTLITHMFLHYDFLHIFLNMYALFIFGPECEREFGRLKFLLLYFISGLTGAFLHVALTTRGDIPAVGASGAIFGVMAAYAMLYPHRRLAVFFFIGFIILPAWALVLFFAVFELLYFFLLPLDSIAHAAHLGGMLGGVIFTWHHKKFKRKERPFIEPIIITYERREEYYDYDYW